MGVFEWSTLFIGLGFMLTWTEYIVYERTRRLSLVPTLLVSALGVGSVLVYCFAETRLDYLIFGVVLIAVGIGETMYIMRELKKVRVINS